MRIFLLLILFSLGLSACTPPPSGSGNSPGNSTRIKAKLIRVTCASKVIQILDPDHYALGETWSDSGSPATTYEHVAKVGNPCEFPDNIAVGSEFEFTINNNPRNDCAVCMMYDAPPSKTVSVTVIP